MKPADLLRRNLRHHWRTHLGVLLGTAVATAVLTGALLVGDSVRQSLKDTAAARVGNADLVMALRGRFFTATLADRIAAELDAEAAPLLRVDGVLVDPRSKRRCNQVQVLGVDDRFWKIGGVDPPPAPGKDGILLNEPLAQRLALGVGDELLLRMRRSSPLSAEAPLSVDRTDQVVARLRVAAILPAGSFGRYSIRAEQVVAHNAFVDIDWLAERVGVEKRANEMLVGGRPGGPVTMEEAQEALDRVWTLADAALELRPLPSHGAIELRSDRIFLEPAVADAAARVRKDALGLLSYFVNTLRNGDRQTPYSVVTALGPLAGQGGPIASPLGDLLPPGMAEDEIAVNQWLADDLGLDREDPLEVRYFVLAPGRKLEERAATFRVRTVLPMDGAALDRSLMPPFAGLEGKEDCRDWDPGIDVELSRIRAKDEAYWNRFRGTPKAFLSLHAGQSIFASRFGDLTAIRFRFEEGAQQAIDLALRETLAPEKLGLRFEPLRDRARRAAGEALDFGQLFVGLSFFLIASALLLTGLLFGLGVARRRTESGILLALGFTRIRVRRLLLVEGTIVAIAGSVLGAAGGVIYTALLLRGLGSVWSGAVAGAAIGLHARGSTLILGAAAGVFVAGLVMWFVLRRQSRSEIIALLDGSDEAAPPRPGTKRASSLCAILCFAAALAVVLFQGAGSETGTASFFVAGVLLLGASLSAIHWFLVRSARTLSERTLSERPPAFAGLSLSGLALRNTARKRMRSLSVAMLLALGTFLVFAVGANKLSPPEPGASRATGTGGFRLIGEATHPLLHDLNTLEGRREFGLDEAGFRGASTVQFRLRGGDDASCLNLNRAQTPRLAGVDSAALRARGAFGFVDLLDGFVDGVAVDGTGEPWRLLQTDCGADIVPAVADQATMVWGLGKKVGDRIEYLDEQGRTFSLLLVGMIGNSILQGTIVIDESAFTNRFPSDEGYRMLLVDAPRESSGTIADTLGRAGENIGFDVTTTEDRLSSFMTVQNTYLAMFQVLGSLGLILGSLGLGFLVLRNVFERQAELAMLRAVGLTGRTICKMLVYEHGWLLFLGLFLGTASALVAVWPALATGGGGVPLLSLSLTLGLLAAGGVFWIWTAATLALRKDLIAALRRE